MPTPVPHSRRSARHLGGAALVTILTVAALLAAPGAVLADCMPPPPLAEAVETAEIVFVGTVVETTNRNSWANVAVEEVWRGPDQPAAVVVRGGPAGNAATSVDRSFEPGVKYIFLPLLQPGEGLTDNSCTNTQPWDEAMAALRPGDARQPLAETAGEGQGFDVASLLPIAAVAALVFVVLLGVGLLARGRQDA